MKFFPIKIKDYKHLEGFLKDLIKLRCVDCKAETIHIIHGWNHGTYCLRCYK